MGSSTRIHTTVDYDQDGKQIGWLRLPHSVTRSAYGNLTMPICVVKNGEGPTALLMAGNHGDEYEGQVALNRFIRELRAEHIQGRVIVLPAANLPAALNGTRTSPIDEGNLNRCFPGDPDGTVTEQIAHYIDSELFPRADVFADFHSGGGSLDFVPWVGMNTTPEAPPGTAQRTLELMLAVGAPLAVNFGEDVDTRVAAIAAMKRGIPNIGGEFGGAGRVSPTGVTLVERTLHNLLRHLGLEAGAVQPAPNPRLMQVPEANYADYFVDAPEPGLFEPFVELGDTVRQGQPCGQVLFVDNPAREPVPVAFAADGFVICKRHPGRVERGDCVAHLAVDWDGSGL